MTSVRSCWKLLLRTTEPMPVECKTDPLLAKDEPIGYGIIYLEPKKGMRNRSADTKVSEEGAEGGTPDIRAEIPPQPAIQIMVNQAVPLQPMEDPIP
ncbi:protein pxr1-like [Willisornis vidua]|uniref:Protein pxr1-like n=1 Tax=Willisornis vidua TaxID=1566151 RepID=A0ABQ9DUC2_9PASS|nr:protein pxr1-like [Willisornis vidua]